MQNLCLSHQRNSHPQRATAFTLVELLVVVGIIALLISILLPSLSRARDQARLTKCLAHSRGLAQAGEVFASDHNGLFQLATSQGVVDHADPTRSRFEYCAVPGASGTQAQELLAWPVALAEAAGFAMSNNWDWGVRATGYLDAVTKMERMETGFDLALCPSDKVRVGSPFFPRYEPAIYGEGLIGSDPDIPLEDPQNGMAYWGRLSYGINEDIVGGDGADLDLWSSCWRSFRDEVSGNVTECIGGTTYGPSSPCFARGEGKRLRGHLDRVFQPSAAGLIFETGADSTAAATQADAQGNLVNLVNSHEANGPYLGHFQQAKPGRMPTRRHQDQRSSVVFADLHGETATPTEFSDQNASGEELPFKYAPRVRVSPFKTNGLGE